jgi:hypothetical protein
MLYTDSGSTDLYTSILKIKQTTDKLVNTAQTRPLTLRAVQEAEAEIDKFLNLVMYKQVLNPLISDVIIYEASRALIFARTAVAYTGCLRKNHKAYRESLWLRDQK